MQNDSQQFGHNNYFGGCNYARLSFFWYHRLRKIFCLNRDIVCTIFGPRPATPPFVVDTLVKEKDYNYTDFNNLIRLWFRF